MATSCLITIFNCVHGKGLWCLGSSSHFENFLHNFDIKQSGLSVCSSLNGWSLIKSVMFRFELEMMKSTRQSYKVRKQMRNSWTYLAAEDPALPAIFPLLSETIRKNYKTQKCPLEMSGLPCPDWCCINYRNDKRLEHCGGLGGPGWQRAAGYQLILSWHPS